jgi:hypothetical protein
MDIGELIFQDDELDNDDGKDIGFPPDPDFVDYASEAEE